MKALALVLSALLALMFVREIEGRPAPLLIEPTRAAAPVDERYCDVPPYRGPILNGPNSKVDYRIGRPFNDKGTA